MAARSTRRGTPVKSCRTMRATVKGISSEAEDGFEYDAEGNGKSGEVEG